MQIHLKPHPVFQRDHDDLHCEMPISFTTAALGGEIEIPNARWRGEDQGPTRNPVRQGLPPARQGHQRRAQPRRRRPDVSRRRGNADQSDRAQKNCCANSRPSAKKTPSGTIRAPSPGWTRSRTSSPSDQPRRHSVTPPGRSSRMMPAALSSSRIRSASAKFLAFLPQPGFDTLRDLRFGNAGH